MPRPRPATGPPRSRCSSRASLRSARSEVISGPRSSAARTFSRRRRPGAERWAVTTSSSRSRPCAMRAYRSSPRTSAAPADESSPSTHSTAPRSSGDSDMDLERDLLPQPFVAESGENLVSIGEAPVQLGATPADDEALRTVFRGAHTVKGNAATLGFPAVADFAHVFEDVLARLREHSLRLSTELASLLLRGVDVLREAIPLAISGAESLPAAHQAVRLALVRFTASGGGAEPSAPPTNDPETATVDGAATASGAADDGHARAAEGRTLRVDVDRLDRMLRLAGEIAISRGRLRDMLDRSSATLDALETHRETDRLF